MMGRRSTYLIANWKLHKTGSEAAAFVSTLCNALARPHNVRVWIAPPYTAISAAVRAANGKVVIGAQDVSAYERGAYTGDVSAELVAAEKGAFSLVGHSERRALFGDSDESVHRKVTQALKAGLKPVLCIGETEKERNEGKTEGVLQRQLEGGLADLSSEELCEVLIAYEPVWAIGTGKAATPEGVAQVHAFCRQFLAKIKGAKIGEEIPLLYGGSVKPANIAELLRLEDVDGALIGGASLSVETFCEMIELTEDKVV